MLVLLLVLTSVSVLSGVAAIDTYATQIFLITPNHAIPPEMVTVILGVAMTLGGLVGLASDSIGRRPLLLMSCVGSVICNSVTGTYYYLLFHTSTNISQYSWIASTFIILNCGISTAGIYPVSSTYISELFNTQTRGKVSSVFTFTITMCSFLVMLMYQPVTYNFGVYVNFYIYTGYTFLATVYFYFTAPETKGRSFSEIHDTIIKS